MLPTCFFTVRSLIVREVAISLFDAPCPMSREEDVRYDLTVPAGSDNENVHRCSATHEFPGGGFAGL